MAGKDKASGGLIIPLLNRLRKTISSIPMEEKKESGWDRKVVRSPSILKKMQSRFLQTGLSQKKLIQKTLI